MSWEHVKQLIIGAIPELEYVHQIYKQDVIQHQVAECACPGAWANEMMVVATSEHLHRKIIVYDCQGTVYIFGGQYPEESAVYLHYTGVHYDLIRDQKAQRQLAEWVTEQEATPLFVGSWIGAMEHTR